MFEKDGRTISLEEAQAAAERKGVSIEEWSSNFGWAQGEGEPKKTGDSVVETATAESVPMTSGGESTSDDISLGQSETFDLTADLQALSRAGMFKGDETEGRKRLEGYFKNVTDLSFEERFDGIDRVRAVYTDPNTGKAIKSEYISFDTKNEKALAKNITNLTSFVNDNISQESLGKISANTKELKSTRQKQIDAFVTPENLAEINTKFDNPELFTPYMETENITPARSASPMSDFQSVSAGTREVEVRPYEAELSTAAKDISLWAEENGADLSPEAIAEGAQDVVRGMLRAEALLDVKQDAAKAATKDNIEKEGDQFVGDVFLQKESAKKYDAILEKAMSAKNQVETSSRAYNKLAALTKGELSMEEQESLGQDLKDLGIAINSDNQNIVRFEDGTEMPEEYFKALEATSELYNSSTLVQKELQNKSSNAAAELGDINTAMDASRRSYDLADKSLNTIATGFGSLGLGLGQIALAGSSSIATQGILALPAQAVLINAQEGINKTRELYQRDVSFEKAFSSGENFGEFMLQETATQIPILITMVASGGAASLVIGTTSAGEKMLDMKTSNLYGETDYSEGEIMLKSAGYGLAEAAFSEITTTRILKNIKADWAGAGKTTLLDNGVKAFLKDKTPALLFEPIAESLGEIGTTGTQNLIDGVPIITGMDHSAFSGYAMGLAMQVIPFVHGGYISRYSDYSAKASIRKKQALVNDIGQRIAAENDPLNKVELEQQYVQANKELTEDIERQEDLVNNNVRADFGQAIIDITAKQSGLQTKAAAIQNDKSKSNTQKKTELAPLQAEFDILQTAKESSLSTRNMQRFRPEFDLLEQTDRAKYDRINDEAVAKLLADKGNFSDPTAQQIKAAAYEIYLEQDIRARNAQASKVEGSKLREFETNEEAIAAIESGEVSVSNPEAVIDNIKKGAHGFSVGGGIQGVIIEAQINDQLRNIATHEIGHGVTDKLLKNDPVKAKKMAEGVIIGLRNALSRDKFDAFIRSATVGGEVNADEILMRFLEMVADDQAGYRDVKAKRNILGLFGATMQKEFAGEYDFDFKGETDIFNFFVGLGKKISSGELTLADIESASQNKILNVTEVTKEAATSTANENSNNTKLSQSGKPTVLESINALVPADVTTKAEFQNRKVFNAVYAATEPGGAISNYVRSKSESKEVADKAMESVVDRLINYDPAAVRKKANGDPITFGEFIFANTNFGKLDARKSLAIEAKETARKVSIDSEQAKEIADKDITNDSRDSGKPRRMNLLTRSIVSTEAISKATKVVESSIGALKVPFNKQTSLNVTVKPYIAALKKGFADKALVKAVAQEMGNGGDLKSWMRKHKAAILDNMTTTYLIGAFPAAIQKQVKGTNTFTSDWAGKEIQREKTTTGNAGKTSGAFMVRRLPNASSKISDAEFVGMLFDDKGVIKPGKKPSLAKAIAEEIGFDILSTEIQNPDGQIAKTFKDNQAAYGDLIIDNFAAEVKKDTERGTAKFSVALANQSPGNRKIILDGIASSEFKNTARALGDVKKPVRTALKTFLPTLELIDIKPATLNIIAQELSPPKIENQYKDTLKNRPNIDAAALLSNKLYSEWAMDYKTIDALNGNSENNYSLRSVDSINSGRLAALWLRNKLGTDKFVRGFFRALTGPARLAGFEITGNIDSIALNEKNIKGTTKTPRYGIFNNVKDGLKNLGIIATKGLFRNAQQTKKDWWSNPNSPYNKLNDAQKKAFLTDLYDNAQIDKSILIESIGALKEGYADGEISLEGIKHILYSQFGDMTGVGKAAAGPSLVPVDATTGKLLKHKDLVAMGLAYENDPYVLEHMIPAKRIALLAYSYITGTNNSSVLKQLELELKQYDTAILPKKLDDQLKKDGLQEDMGLEYVPGDSVIDTRYKDVGIAFYDAKTGKVVGQSAAKLALVIPPARRVESAKRTEQDIATNKASAKFSIAQEQNMSKAINDMIERTKGVQSEKVFSAVQAKKRGKTIGKYKFLSPAADDFRGLTSYTFAGKGKQGEADQKFFEEKMIRPYQRGINAIDVAKQTIKNDFTAVVKAFAPQAKIMRNKIPGSDYTYDQAIRVYMWTRQGTEVPGMSKRDLALLNKTVAEDPAMIAFADAMLLVSKQGEWMEPGEHWLTNTVLSDLNNMSEKIGRKVYLEEFLVAKDIIFSPDNLAKIEAVYGSKYTSALKDILYRMENGTNRPSGSDATTNRWLNWINQSTGAIMFFNRRSAILQLLSTVNFINWSDNNPAKAAMAFANQKQFWGDFAMLFNSPKLKQRRAGLRTDVSQAEIANAVAGQTNKAAAVLNYLLKIGFTPTQIADSFAVASGGATFYRNRVNTYLKQGKSQKEAETLAFEEFSSTADEAQQSSDPMLISQQQASMLGRLVLAFQNTTMQYSRLMKKATLDLVNGRGDPKTNISKIIYYGAVQNFIFSSLQSALFAVIPGFGGDDEGDEEVLDKKGIRILNSMFDSLLKGTGLTGAVIATIKNVIQEYAKQEEKGYNADHIYTFLRLMSISPPIGSKLSKLYKAQQTRRFEKDALKERPFDVFANGRVNLGPGYRIVGNIAAATVNLPLDRVVDEVTSLSEALDNRNTQWQRLALALGWKSWDVGAKNEEQDLLKAEGKVRRDAEGKVKAAETRAANKKAEAERFAGLTMEEKMAEKKAAATIKREKRIAAKEARIAAKKKAAAEKYN